MYSAIENADVFTNLIQNDVLYQLTTAYPIEGVILAEDVLALEAANSEPNIENRQSQIKRVFEEIQKRAVVVKADALQSREAQQTHKSPSSDAPKLNVLY
ncbi:hypothetical protein [Vibrio harveyi]|uniref:hypothetical protein n=1 Tax=Vibrio harveyi TaxID=669 RepID=UPI00247FBAE5|nr:hypothetical protein [Vibrio harveyi]